MSRKIRVAAIQATSLAANWDEKWQGIDIPHAVELLEQAASGGADLACFPELYPLAGRGELCEAARKLDVHVIAGLAEGEPPKWQNTSTVISNAGTVLGVQTKNYPTALEVDRGVVPGDAFPVFESDLGRIGIVICADFAFFHDGVEANCRHQADMIFNPALWFALSEAFPHTVIGRHMEYSVPVFGVNIGRPREGFRDSIFPPAGGFSTACVPPPVRDMDELWEWFCDKPGGIDSTEGFIHTLGPDEDILYVDVDIEAVRNFPGYFSTRTPVRPGG